MNDLEIMRQMRDMWRRIAKLFLVTIFFLCLCLIALSLSFLRFIL